MIDILEMYSVREFLNAISTTNGKFTQTLGSVIYYEFCLIEKLLSSFNMIISLISAGTQGKFGQLKLAYDDLKGKYEQFKTDKPDFTGIIEKLQEEVKDDHDKADLLSASRIPSLLWWIISFAPGISEEQKEKIGDLQKFLNQVDAIHGLIYRPELSEIS
jgi:hypothetical protein